MERVARLPHLGGTFFGRDEDLNDLRSLLESERLITVTGPGGCGKTRLAVETARECADGFPDGTFFVDLSSLADEQLTASVVGHAVGIESSVTDETQVADVLSDQECLLVLDNCEHAATAVADLASALTACPHVRLLVTSRVALGVAGEIVFRIQPLPLPEQDDVGSVRQSAAALLFCDRAARLRRGFRLSDDNAPDVARICRALDGLPLGLELAASAAGSMSSSDLADRAEALRGHESLEACVRWSYERLDPRSQTALRYMARFAGTFTAGDAASLYPDVDLASLVDASLVEMVDDGGPSKYHLLETVKAFARAEEGDQASIAKAHFEWASALARSPDRAEPMLDDVRTALDWGISADPSAAGLLALDLVDLWTRRGYLREGLHYLEMLVRAVPAEMKPLIERAAALVTEKGGDLPEAARRYEELSRGTGGPRFKAECLRDLGRVRRDQGDLSAARTALEDAMAVASEPGAGDVAIDAACYLTRVEWGEGKREAATDRCRRMLEKARKRDDAEGQAKLLHLLGIMARSTGDHPRAERLIEEARQIWTDNGDRSNLVECLLSLSDLHAVRGERERATAVANDALDLAREIDASMEVGKCLGVLGSLAVLDGDSVRARGLLDEAVAVAERCGDRHTRGVALLDLATIEHGAGRRHDAAKLLAEAVEVFRSAGAPIPLAVVLASLASAEAGLGRDDQARAHLDEAAGLAPGVPFVALNIERAQAVAARQAGDHERAAALLDSALAKARELGDQGLVEAVTREAEGVARAEPAPVRSAAPTMEQHGSIWEVSVGGEITTVKDGKGARYLAALMAQGGREVHVLELAALDSKVSVESEGLEAFDAEALRSYRDRLSELRSEVEEAEVWSDTERAAKARAEIEAIERELASGIGIGGRLRQASSNVERARWAVRKALRTTVARIGTSNPVLGAHFERAVKTGTFCSYQPSV